ncbi:hypothetical protein IG631_20494 [Alternaria alternata]|nr:hypothetical protein IG631_20494 [Alternaria alternata]
MTHAKKKAEVLGRTLCAGIKDEPYGSTNSLSATSGCCRISNVTRHILCDRSLRSRGASLGLQLWCPDNSAH